MSVIAEAKACIYMGRMLLGMSEVCAFINQFRCTLVMNGSHGGGPFLFHGVCTKIEGTVLTACMSRPKIHVAYVCFYVLGLMCRKPSAALEKGSTSKQLECNG